MRCLGSVDRFGCIFKCLMQLFISQVRCHTSPNPVFGTTRGTEARRGKPFCLSPEVSEWDAGLIGVEARMLCSDGLSSMPVGPLLGVWLVQVSGSEGQGPEGCWLSVQSSISELQPETYGSRHVGGKDFVVQCPSPPECELQVPTTLGLRQPAITERGSTVRGWSPGQPGETCSPSALSQWSCSLRCIFSPTPSTPSFSFAWCRG